MSKSKRWMAVAVAAGIGVGAWWLASGDEGSEAEGARLLKNHAWISHMPQGERDMVKFFVAIDHRDGKMGAAGRASQWRLLADSLQWGLQGDKLSLYFGQEEVRWTANVRAWRCEGEAPEGFELCLELSDDHHNVKFYSRDDWELDPEAVDVEVAPELPFLSEAVERALSRHAEGSDAGFESYAPTQTVPWTAAVL